MSGPAILRGLAATICFALAFGACFPVTRATLDWLEVGPGRLQMGNIGLVRRWQASVPTAGVDPRIQSVGIVGNSMIMGSSGMKDPARGPIPEELDRFLHERAPRSGIRIRPLRWPGLHPFDVYFFADEIADTVPNVILCFSVRTLWKSGLGQPPGLVHSSWIRPARLPSALALPLHRAGLSTDRLLRNVAITQIGGFGAWVELRRHQVRVELLLDDARRALSGGASPLESHAHAIRTRTFFAGRTNRRESSPVMLDILYGAALEGVTRDHPVVQVQAAAIQTLRDAGVGVLFVVMPINLELLAHEGKLSDRRGLDRTLTTLREISEEAGAQFLDLHELLDARGFRDRVNHMTFEGELDGERRVVEALAPHVLGLVKRPRPRRAASAPPPGA